MIQRLPQCCLVHTFMRKQSHIDQIELLNRVHYLIMASRKESNDADLSRAGSGRSSSPFRRKASFQQLESQIRNQEKRFMIVGLGNEPFPDTRHSVGMRATDMLASLLGKTWNNSTKAHGGYFCEALLERRGMQAFLVLFKPKALMNVNGVPIAKAAKSFFIPSANIYLIHDELDKPVGTFHIKEGGSARGHNGVLSCMSCLQSREMRRLRIGISRPSSKSQIVNYVLGKIPKEDLPAIDGAISDGLDGVLDHIVKRMDTSRQAENSEQKLGVKQKRQMTKKFSKLEESESAAQEVLSVEKVTSVQAEPIKGQNSVQLQEDREHSPER